MKNKLQKDQGRFQGREKPDKPKRTTRQTAIRGRGGGSDRINIGRPRKCKECKQNLPSTTPNVTGSGPTKIKHNENSASISPPIRYFDEIKTWTNSEGMKFADFNSSQHSGW